MGIFSTLFGASQAEPTSKSVAEEPQDRGRVEAATKRFGHFGDKLTKSIRKITPLELGGRTRCLLAEHAYKRGVNPTLAGAAAGIGAAGVLGNALGSAMELREYFVLLPCDADASADFCVHSSRTSRDGEPLAGTRLVVTTKANRPASELVSSKLRDALVAEGGKVIVEREGDAILIAMAAETDITLGGRNVRNRLLRVASAAVE